MTVTFLTLVFFLLLVFLAGFLANSLLAVVEQRAASSAGMLDGEAIVRYTPCCPSLTRSEPDWFVSDHVLVGEGVREAVAFVSHQLEESSLIAGRQLALDRMARSSADASDASYSYIGSFFGRRTPGAAEAESLANAPFWARAILHFTKGSALVGIVSVFYSFVGKAADEYRAGADALTRSACRLSSDDARHSDRTDSVPGTSTGWRSTPWPDWCGLDFSACHRHRESSLGPDKLR